MGIIGRLFDAIRRFFADAFTTLMTFLKKIFVWLVDAIAFLLKPLFSLLDAIFYFLYKLGLLLIEVVFVVIAVVRLLLGLLIGGAKTILSLSYDGRGANLGGMAQHFEFLHPFIEALKLNVLAGVFAFGIWVMTFFAAQKIIGNFK
jgi:hypothetical protein